MYEVKMKFPVGGLCVLGGGGLNQKSPLWEGRGMDFAGATHVFHKKRQYENVFMKEYGLCVRIPHGDV